MCLCVCYQGPISSSSDSPPLSTLDLVVSSSFPVAVVPDVLSPFSAVVGLPRVILSAIAVMSSTNDNAMTRFLFAILQQKSLKDVSTEFRFPRQQSGHKC